MYPRAPRSMMPQEGDVTEPRNCNFCGNSLAEYRGVVETAPTELNPDSTITSDTASIITSDTETTTKTSSTKANGELFFCNYEHQADFHAGRIYKY